MYRVRRGGRDHLLLPPCAPQGEAGNTPATRYLAWVKVKIEKKSGGVSTTTEETKSKEEEARGGADNQLLFDTIECDRKRCT